MNYVSCMQRPSVGRDEDVLDLGEGLERVGTALASDAALLEAAAGCRVEEAAVRVDREVAGLGAAGNPQAAPEGAGPDGPGEAVCRVVGHGDRVGLVVE